MATPFLIPEKPGMQSLMALVEALRGENGCPWDKKQTPSSMASYLTEELYELLEAIDEDRPDNICAELGDLLFHIFFIARLFEEKGLFDIHDVISATLSKMVHRHPHVFGQTHIDDADGVKDQWHRIKQNENNGVKKNSVVDSVPAGTPALLRAYRISDRVARTGFDWPGLADALKKVDEELAELKAALSGGKTDAGVSENAALEFGDVLFALVNIARFAGIQPETALNAAIRKFSRRFRHLEKAVAKQQSGIDSLSHQEMHRLWEQAKEASEVKSEK